MTSRPAPRKSGRAPKHDDSLPVTALHSLEQITLDALYAAVYLQNLRGTPDTGPKSAFLSQIATDLELALIERRPRELTDRLCLDIAATALRILEQGDGRERGAGEEG